MWIRSRLYSLVKEKGTVAAICKLLYIAAGYSSAIYAFLEILMVGVAGMEDCFKGYWWTILLAGVVVALFHNRDRTTLKNTVGEMQVEVRINDLFRIKANSYVIPTNTFFRTKMEGEYISPESVQGRFQLKYYEGRIEELDQLICQSIKEQKIEGTVSRHKFGEVKKYPIGTIAKVDRNGKHYYFVAISDVNEFGKPVGQEYENIRSALNGLIMTICTIGHCDELAIPPIGTGISITNPNSARVDIAVYVRACHGMSFEARYECQEMWSRGNGGGVTTWG